MKNRNRLQRQSLFDDPHSLSATGLAMVGHFDSAVREHHLVFVQDYHRRSAPRAVGSRGCIAALINILAGHAGLRREETRSGASSFQFSDCRYLPMTWPYSCMVAGNKFSFPTAPHPQNRWLSQYQAYRHNGRPRAVSPQQQRAKGIGFGP